MVRVNLPFFCLMCKIKIMTKAIIPSAPHKNFEGIKKIDENGIEYWEARELMPLLGYGNWQKAEEVIARAARACIKNGQAVGKHFYRTGKKVENGSKTIREIKKYKIKRDAC